MILIPETVIIRANLFITVREHGMVVREEAVHNLVVLAGRNLIRDLLGGDSSAKVGWFAVGTGTVAPTPNDIALGAQTFRDAITSHLPASGSTTMNYFLGSTSANGVTLSEAGLFTALSAGTMYARATFTGIPKNLSTTINFSWVSNIGAS